MHSVRHDVTFCILYPNSFVLCSVDTYRRGLERRYVHRNSSVWWRRFCRIYRLHLLHRPVHLWKLYLFTQGISVTCLWFQYWVDLGEIAYSRKSLYVGYFLSFNPLDPKGNYSATSNNTKLVRTLAVDGWAVTFGTARRALGKLRSRPIPSSLYQM